MNIALVIDDPTRIDYVVDTLLDEVKELDNFFGMHAYQGRYNGQAIKIFFIGSNKESIALRTEDWFLFENLDIVINVGYCYVWPNSKKVFDGDYILVSSAKCDCNYKSLLDLQDSQNRKSSDLDKRIEKKILELSKKIDCEIIPVACYSSSEIHGIPDNSDGKINCPCFDKKAFALYEIAAKHNRHTICLYAARSANFVDVHHFLLDKRESDLDNLIKLALEFSLKFNY